MLTSYLVRCPHVGCRWFGSLLPVSHCESWRGAAPTVPVAEFQCPECFHAWQARIIGDDVEALPHEEGRFVEV